MNSDFSIFRRYRFTSVVLAALFISFSVVSFAQKVTIRAERSSLKSVIQQLEKQSVYRFLYADESLKESLPVTINMVSTDFRDALKEIFSAQPLEIQIQEKNVIIKNKQQESASLSGVVRHYETKSPMSGVTIKIVGNNLEHITISNVQGSYGFTDLPYGVYQLSYSYVGFVTSTSTVQIYKKNVLVNTALTPLDKKLEQVVIIGYGTKQQRDLTSSVSSIN